MNKDSFLRYIEKTRDCGEARLDFAVNGGLQRAKSGRPDSRKFFMLAAACVFVLVLCMTVNIDPVKGAAEDYFLNRNIVMQDKGKVLDNYIEDITHSIEALAELQLFKSRR